MAETMQGESPTISASATHLFAATITVEVQAIVLPVGTGLSSHDFVSVAIGKDIQLPSTKERHPILRTDGQFIVKINESLSLSATFIESTLGIEDSDAKVIVRFRKQHGKVLRIIGESTIDLKGMLINPKNNSVIDLHLNKQGGTVKAKIIVTVDEKQSRTFLKDGNEGTSTDADTISSSLENRRAKARTAEEAKKAAVLKAAEEAKKAAELKAAEEAKKAGESKLSSDLMETILAKANVGIKKENIENKKSSSVTASTVVKKVVILDPTSKSNKPTGNSASAQTALSDRSPKKRVESGIITRSDSTKGSSSTYIATSIAVLLAATFGMGTFVYFKMSR
eukprot:CAMPEP_0182437516 /NCGR_PEP_ID=MMETSP1167-20130531/85098_1 /TAXON_ID=2988 /ORGANISM="Mallomonas Sp, Strain CCMP3275" /LENGTH=338 /DNA_ID=CAMNT_0024630459 /DNA_START=183 /DNA_END=1199 /DNA_ORIENTATION=+